PSPSRRHGVPGGWRRPGGTGLAGHPAGRPSDGRAPGPPRGRRTHRPRGARCRRSDDASASPHAGDASPHDAAARLGTKSTRHEILDLLFRRQYISGRSIRTTAAGRALVDALTIYGPDVTDPEMTRHLEDRMTAIAEGRATLTEVVDESRRDLHEVLAELRAHQPS